MRKFLALFLALLMCVGVFASCAPKTEDGGVTLEQAKDYLYNVMKDKNGKAISNDYNVVAKIIIDETSFDVTWKTDNEDIKIVESTKENMWTVDLPDKNEEEFEYKLTATITAADGSTIEVTFTPKLPVIDNTGVTTAPEENKAYKIFLKQLDLGYTLYALNTTQDGQNKFINTTLDPKEAADFYMEEVDGGYKIYTMIDDVKTYVHAKTTTGSDGKVSKFIGFATETDSVFVYDSEKGVYTVTINGAIYGVGTYGSYETISLSDITYFTDDKINVKEGQFPIGFMEADYAETLAPDEKPVFQDPAADSTLTIAQAIALGETRAKNQYTDNKYYVTGQITSITSEQYGNMMISDGTNEILVYGTYDADGTNRYDAMTTKPVVGDTVTVYGIIGMYNDPQIKNGWIKAINGTELGGTTPTPPAGGDDDGGATPPAGDPAALPIDATITDSMPATLTYITNNADYPNPAFYSAGGLKMNFVNMGVQTVAFAAQNSVKVTIKVAALNQNTKTGSDADVFTVYGLDASGNTVATATYDAVVAGDNVVLLEGTGIVSVKVIMTDYAHDGTAFCNISLGGIKVEVSTAGGDDDGGATPPPAGGGDDGGATPPPAGGDDDGGATPPAGTGTVLVDATIENSIPAALTYITNNSQYPNPSFYSSGALKMNYVNMGVQTTTFAAQNSVKVTIKVSALNTNTKTGSDADVFTVYGLDASGNTVATATYDAVVAGDNVVILEGEGIVAVKVIMTDYAHNGTAFCNIALGGVKVEN